MIRLLNLKIKNFLSYKEAEFNFLNKKFCLIDGWNYDENDQNAAGKTAIFEAIAYSLQNSLSKNIKIGDIVRRGSKKCEVTLDFQENENSYRIERGRKPNFLRFYINGIEVDEDPQGAIDRVIGMSQKTFYRCVYFPQKSNTNYLISNDRDKKDIFTNILEDLSVFDEANKKVKKDKKNKEDSLVLIDNQLTNDKEKIDKILDDAKYYKDKCNNFEKERSNKLESLKNNKTHVLETIEKEKARINKLKESIKSGSSIDNEKLDKLNENLGKLKVIKSKKEDFDRKVWKLGHEIDSIEEKIEESSKIKKNICPTCNQVIKNKDNANINQDKINALKEDLKTKNEERKFYREKIEKAETQLAKQDRIEKKINDINKLKHENEVILKREIPSIEKNIEGSHTRINEIESNIKSVENSKNTYKDILDKLKSEYKDIKKRYEKSQKKEKEINKEIVDLALLEEAFGKNGIKSYVFESVVIELNDKIKYYLDKLFDRDVELYFDTKKEKKTGEVVQEFNTIIKINEEEVSYGSLSGGEQRRVIIAVDLALADIISKRCQKSFNVKFFDESFNELSSSGKETTMYLLKEMSQDLDMIGVVDHSTEFRGIFDNVVKVELKDGISKIKEGS